MTSVLRDPFSRLVDSNFIVRMLFYETYWQHSIYLCVICATFITTSLLQLRFISYAKIANSQINAVGIKLRLLNVNFIPIRVLNKGVLWPIYILCFYHYQRCASYTGTLNCPGLLLPGTRDIHPRFRDSPGNSGTVGHSPYWRRESLLWKWLSTVRVSNWPLTTASDQRFTRETCSRSIHMA